LKHGLSPDGGIGYDCSFNPIPVQQVSQAKEKKEVRYSLMLLPALLAGAVSAGEITLNFELPVDAVEMAVFEGFDVPVIQDGVLSFDEGYPGLPGIPSTFVIPQGTTLSEVNVRVLSSISLEGVYNLEPARYFSLNAAPGPRTRIPSVWSSDDAFPSSPAIAIESGSKTGFRLGTYTFVPFIYHPMSGALSMITSAEITLVYEDDPAVEQLSLTETQISIAREGLANIVENPEMLSAWSPALRDGGTDWSSWVVIADPDWQTMLQPLVDLRSTTEGSAEFVSCDWIYANYAGYDTQEKIRNYIKDAYQNHGLVYALIVGDWGATQRISMLNVSGNLLNSTADLYYSDLDGTWDADGDHNYGESSDGLDYYSDIYVGRFSTDVAARLQTMVDRTVAYETDPTPGAWKTTALFPAGGLWPESGYWGSFLSDSLIKRIPTSWTIYKLYETYASHPNNQIALLNAGVSFCEPTGHGSEGGVYWYYNPPTDIISSANYTGLTNMDRLPIMSSIACLSGKLSNVACIAERLMFWTTGGAVAVMFNSDNGWGTPPSMGPSEWLEVHMANQFWPVSQWHIGIMHGLGKDEFKASGGMSFQGWVLQEHNLLGDPALTFVAGQTGIEEEEGGALPMLPILSVPTPNPSISGCSVRYDLPETSNVTVTVFDISGRSVRVLHEGILQVGEGQLNFDGRDSSGATLPSGCYSVVLTGPAGAASTMMVIAR
jgi:hypothetical protein